VTVLVDTSVWIRALVGAKPFAPGLDELLEGEGVLAHELVFGELLIGGSAKRAALLASYGVLPAAATVPHDEVVAFARARKLPGRGIGWIDAHLLASTIVAGARLWTADARLDAVAGELGVAWSPA
jgi:predicted nucleic acid-binding protein